MSDYLKLFETHDDYEDFVDGGTMVKPNVSYCEDENEVHYNPIFDPFNGHTYVDLGLPSGTLWATVNIGADEPQESGYYFAWGETQGYTSTQIGSGANQKYFSWDDYELAEGSNTTITKYNSTISYGTVDNLTQLEKVDDAVSSIWGGNWHIPTRTQYQELLNTEYVTNEWVTNYQNSGVNGRLFTSVANGNTIFIPAAKLYYCGNADDGGYLFSSTLRTGRDSYALTFTNASITTDFYLRPCGSPLRGVIDNLDEESETPEIGPGEPVIVNPAVPS